jgi:hypothetical protein
MKVEDPLKGWPATKPLTGTGGFRVNAKHLTPGRLKLTDIVIFIVLPGSLGLFLGAVLDSSNPNASAYFMPGSIAWIVGALSLGIGRKAVGTWLFGKTAVIEFQPDMLRIRGLLGFKNYNRMLPHEFTIETHENAEWEAKQEVKAQYKAQRAGRVELPDKTPYFRDAFVVVLRYAGQRVPVATVCGRKRAEALLVRLQLLDQVMDAARGEIGAPVAAEPGKQYGERPEAG